MPKRPNYAAMNHLEPTPGDVGRFALHASPMDFADALVQWCGSDTEINDVARWLEIVATRLRALREQM